MQGRKKWSWPPIFLQKEEKSESHEDKKLELPKKPKNESAWKSFLGRLFPFLWLLLPMSLLILSSIYQASQTLEKDQQIPIEKTVEIHSSNGEVVFLHIVYPQKVNLSEAGTANAPISVWMSYASPFTVATPTLTKQSGIPTQSTGASATAIPTPTSTEMPYILSLNVKPKSLTFTDEKGRPVSSQIILTPAGFGVTPEILFVQVNSMDGDIPVNIIPSLQHKDSTLTLPPILVKHETQSTAWWRNFWSLMLTPTLIGALLVALASLAIQQWGKAEDERRIKSKDFEDKNRERKELTENLRMLIKDKPADGARKYLEIQRMNGESGILEAVWSDAPEELKNLVELERTYKNSEGEQLIKTLGVEKVEQALKLAIRHSLDEDWESRATAILEEIIRQNLLNLDGQLLQLTEQRSREALLKVWPSISYWRLLPPPDRNASIQDKWAFYAESPYPFGAPHAEENSWLFGGRFNRYGDQTALSGIERMDSVIILGTPGWGKTSTALWLMDYAMRIGKTFPVYIPATINITLTEIASVFAKTILHYLAINPSAYLRRGVAGRASIAHLLAEYLGAGPKLTLLLREAGLPQTGAGLDVEQDIHQQLENYPTKSLNNEQEILNLLSESYPDGFNKTWILLDVQKGILSGTNLAHFLKLIRQLNWIGLKTKIFISSTTSTLVSLDVAPIPVRRLEWSIDNLIDLINTRLQELGEESLTALCKPELRQDTKTPEERLAAAAKGKPGRLAQKGNELLKRISQNQNLLSGSDLDEILGPVS